MVDIARPDIARAKRLKRILYGTGFTVVIILITVGVSRLEPAAPRVDRDTVFMDTVQRGEMLRQVRGTGTLVPEEIRWISATTSSTVETILLRPGVTVEPHTAIVELSNPQLEQSALEAELQLDASRARYQNRQVALNRDLLTQQASVSNALSELSLAEYEAQQNEQLYAEGLVSELDLRRSQSREDQARTRHEIEEDRLEIQTNAMDTELAVEQAEVDRLETIWQLRQDEVAALRVTAGVSGVLQEVPPRGRGQRLDRHQSRPRGRSLAAESRVAYRPDAGARHPDRPAGRDRHPQRHHPGTGDSHRPGGAGGHRHRGRLTRGRAAPRRPPGPDGGWHDRTRTAR